MPDQRLTDHFTVAEFRSHDGEPVPPRSYRALHRLCEFYLEPLRGKFGPVHVTSGHRSVRHNAEVGGAPRSQHVYGMHGWGVAADVTCQLGTPRDWYAFLDQLHAGGLGLYPSWVHVDNRTGRARW